MSIGKTAGSAFVRRPAPKLLRGNGQRRPRAAGNFQIKLSKAGDYIRLATACSAQPLMLPEFSRSDGLGNQEEMVKAGAEKNFMPAQQKNLRVCRVGAFENPQCTGAPQPRILDPTAGWACKHRRLFWLPAGTPSVRQKTRRITYTAEVCEAVASLMKLTVPCPLLACKPAPSTNCWPHGQPTSAR
jgi:hypothetical protein